MRNAKKIILALSLFGVFFTSSLPAYASPELNEQQLKQLLVGKTMVWRLRGETGTMLFRPNGTIYGEHDFNSDNGVYEIKKNGQYCRKWQNWSNGDASCYAVIKNKDSYVAILKSGPASPRVPFTMKK